MRDERRDIRLLVQQLTPEQWEADSLCAGWTVRDVVAHLIGWDDLLLYRTRGEHVRAVLRFAALYVASGASMRVVNRRISSRTDHLATAELRARFGADDGADLRWLFDGSNPGAHLAEYVIHHRDILGPLGLHRRIRPDRLVGALDGVTKLPGVRLTAWLRLGRRRWKATDVDWSGGRGAVRFATGEDILLALAGRVRC